MKHLLTAFLSAGLPVFLCSFSALARASSSPSTRVLIIGDSMMRITAHAMELQLDRRGDDIEHQSFTSLGSGLARLDKFDWMAKIDELVQAFEPDVTVVWFGANDRQAMRTKQGIIHPDSAGWPAEYTRRVGQVMDKLTATPESRVIWLELPDLREESLQRDAAVINPIFEQEAQKREAVDFFETRSLLSRKPGTYTAYIIGPDGMPLSVRSSDGVHLNRAGADLIAETIVRQLLITNSESS